MPSQIEKDSREESFLFSSLDGVIRSEISLTGLHATKFSFYLLEGVVNPDRWSEFVAWLVIRVKDTKRCLT